MDAHPELYPEDNQKKKSARGGFQKSGGALLVIIGLVLIAIFGFDLPSLLPSSSSEPVSVAPLVGSQAPSFTLKDLNGNDIALKELRGKFVLINFWATWCGPCRLEMPHFQARHEQLSEDLVILAVNFDEPDELVQAFANELGLTFDILLDPGAVVQDVYEIRAYPSTFFVDRDGVINNVRIGILTEDMLDEFLGELGLY